MLRMGQAAQLLGVSTDTVRRWADAGRLPTTRTDGGRRVVDGVALAEFARTLAVEGAGKTTLLRVLLRADEGRVTWTG